MSNDPTSHNVYAVQYGVESGSVRAPHTSTGTLWNKIGETLGKGSDNDASHTFLFNPTKVDIWDGKHSLHAVNLTSHREANVQISDHIEDADQRESTISHHQGMQYVEHGNLSDEKGLQMQLRGYTNGPNSASGELNGRMRLQRTRGMRLYSKDTCSPSCIEVGIPQELLEGSTYTVAAGSTTVTVPDSSDLLVGDNLVLTVDNQVVEIVSITDPTTVEVFPAATSAGAADVFLLANISPSGAIFLPDDSSVILPGGEATGATVLAASSLVNNLVVGANVEVDGADYTLVAIDDTAGSETITISPPYAGVTVPNAAVTQYSARAGFAQIITNTSGNMEVGKQIRMIDPTVGGSSAEIRTIVDIETFTGTALVTLDAPLSSNFLKPNLAEQVFLSSEKIYIDDIQDTGLFQQAITLIAGDTVTVGSAADYREGCVVEFYDVEITAGNNNIFPIQTAIVTAVDTTANTITVDRTVDGSATHINFQLMKQGDSLFFEGGYWNCEDTPVGQYVGRDEHCVAQHLQNMLLEVNSLSATATFDDTASQGNSAVEVPKFPSYVITNTGSGGKGDPGSFIILGGSIFGQIGANVSYRGDTEELYGTFTKPIYFPAGESVEITASTPMHGFKLLNWRRPDASASEGASFSPERSPDFGTECWKFRVLSEFNCESNPSSIKDLLKVQQTLVRDDGEQNTPAFPELRPLTAQSRVDQESGHTGVYPDHQVLTAWNQRVFDTTVYGSTGLPNLDFKIWSYDGGNLSMNTGANNGAKPLNGSTFWAFQYVGEDYKSHRVSAWASGYETQQHQIILQRAEGSLDESNPLNVIESSDIGGTGAGRFINEVYGSLEIAQMGGESSRSRLDCNVKLRTGHWYRLYHQVENTSLQGQGVEKNTSKLPLGAEEDVVFAELRIQDAL